MRDEKVSICFGSNSDLGPRQNKVRSPLHNGQAASASACPKDANLGNPGFLRSSSATASGLDGIVRRAHAKRDRWQLLRFRLSGRLNKEGYQRWQNIPASVFAERFEWKHLGNRKPWVTVIADHVVRGQVDQSTPLASGSQML
jgi:hypothetical protein